MSLTDAQNRALVKKAIAAAESQAKDDAEFARLLQASFVSAHPDIVRDRLRGAARAQEKKAPDPRQSIRKDPRFQRNLRKLAERTRQNLRIIGGNKVPGKEFPDCVAVGDDDEYQCTGTLIAPNVVLSAGHCSTVATRVFFGSDVGKKGTEIGVKKCVRHPMYRKGGKENDLLVLVLDKKASVKPRRIATAAAINAATEGRAVGFGSTNPNGDFGYGVKRQVDVPIVSPGCSGKVNGEADSVAYGCDRLLEIVAGKQVLGRDSCKGDSGGPFYVADGKKGWLLAGATSRATAGAVDTCGDGGIYVRVDKYVSWIEKAAGIKL